MVGKVLIVDDSDFDRRMIMRALTKNGLPIEIEAVESGPAALGQLKEFRPDLILLDIRMPGMDGFDVLRHLKNTQEWCDYPVIMLSGSSEDKDRKRAAECGADAYYVKPSSISAYSEIAKEIGITYFS